MMFLFFYTILMIFLFLVVCIVFLLLLYLIYSFFIFFFIGVPFLPTSKKYFKVLFKELTIKQNDVIYDLGSGTGDFLLATRKEFGKKPKLIGYEFSPALVWLSRFRSYLQHADTRFVRCDFLKADISDADVIYLFLIGPVLPKVWQKIKQETKHGTVVISLSSPIPDILYYKKVKANLDKKRDIWFYFYRV